MNPGSTSFKWLLYGLNTASESRKTVNPETNQSVLARSLAKGQSAHGGFLRPSRCLVFLVFFACYATLILCLIRVVIQINVIQTLISLLLSFGIKTS